MNGKPLAKIETPTFFNTKHSAQESSFKSCVRYYTQERRQQLQFSLLPVYIPLYVMADLLEKLGRNSP